MRATSQKCIAHNWLIKYYGKVWGPSRDWVDWQRVVFRAREDMLTEFVTDCWPNELVERSVIGKLEVIRTTREVEP